jgi:cytochrome c biogenesis protein CcmG, thiol:disulfide interchange protein DsbE
VTRRQQWAVVAAAVAAMVAALAAGAHLMEGRMPVVAVGAEAPDFRVRAVPPLEGMRSLRDYRGKVVLLNVWATWCTPCREEMPSLERLYQEYRRHGLAVVAVSEDDDANVRDLRTFADDLGLTFDIVYDSLHAMEKPYQITGYPVTFVIDRSGVIRRRHLGAADWSSIGSRSLVASLLGVPLPDSTAAGAR